MSIEERAESARTEAEGLSKPGVFSLLERLEGRAFPTRDVTVYVDEQAGYDIMLAEQDLKREQDLLGVLAGDEAKEQLAKVDAIEAKLAELQERAAASSLTFHLKGISTDAYDAVIDAAREEFPLEYREERNPMTLKTEREVIESEDRETFFRIHLWAKYIVKVTDAAGNEDVNITPELVKRAQDLLPLAAVARIQLIIEDLRMISDWMDHVQGSDFLAKS